MKLKSIKSLVIISVLIALFTGANLGFNFTNLTSSSTSNEEKYIEHIKISATYNSTVEIDDTDITKNWEVAKVAGVCTGAGTPGDPYIISDDLFNTTSGSVCLAISHSRKHFEVLNCD